MKSILEYLYNRKRAIKSSKPIQPTDIVLIGEYLYVFLSDEMFEKIDPKYRDLLYKNNNPYDLTKGIFYNNGGYGCYEHNWMPVSVYNDELKCASGTNKSAYDIQKVWRAYNTGVIDKYTRLDANNLNALIKSSNYKLIWER